MSNRPRSATDATRFTQTGPYANSRPNYASSKPTASSKSSATAGQARPGETPLEKVHRLREAARRARLDRISPLDRAILVGRVWADRAHRVVVGFLMISSVVCGVYATVAVTDMIVYNRRKKREWYAQQQEIYSRSLAEATVAEERGQATDDQLAFLSREHQIQEAEKRQKGRLWTRVKEGLFGAGDEDVVNIERLKSSDLVNARPKNKKLEESSEAVSATGGAIGGVVQAVEDARREQQQQVVDVESRPGGPLDQLASYPTKTSKLLSSSSSSRTNSGGLLSWLSGWGNSNNNNDSSR